jgi:hypothetical protein
MIPSAFDRVIRGVAVGGSRRALLAATFGSLFAVPSLDSGASRIGTLRNRNEKRQDKKGNDSRKDKNGRKKKNKNSTAKGCHDSHSEEEILNFIAKAAKKYGQSNKVMVRVARCESSLDPCAFSKSGPYYGLYQFLKSTWKTTPYGDKSIYDPKAQALAAGWMWKQGRKNEWSCQ